MTCQDRIRHVSEIQAHRVLIWETENYVGEPVCVPESGCAALAVAIAAVVETVGLGEVVLEPVVHCARDRIKDVCIVHVLFRAFETAMPRSRHSFCGRIRD